MWSRLKYNNNPKKEKARQISSLITNNKSIKIKNLHNFSINSIKKICSNIIMFFLFDYSIILSIEFVQQLIEINNMDSR